MTIFYASDSRFPQPEVPGLRICISQRGSSPVIPTGTGFSFFIASYELQGYCGVIRNTFSKDVFTVRNIMHFIDHLCGLVVRVPGYRSKGPSSISGATRFSEKY
jgi:hypothetical protein